MVEGSTVPKVNLTEVLEVRGDGLTPSELLSVLASSCEYLISAKSGGTHGKLFLVDQMFLTRNGRVEIQLSSCGLSKKFVPPELQEQNEQFEEQPNLSEAQLVWCLGTSCLRVVRSGHSDVTLFSLLNLMTVGHVQSRPTLSKVWLMVRNQLGVDGLAKVPEVVSSLFKEVMGDLDELLADSFDDDIRFSSSRSSKLSIIPGPGAPEHFAHETSDHQQNLLVSEVTDRLRTEFSYLFDDEYTTINAVDIPSGFERKGSITPTQPSQHPLTQQQKPYEHSEDEGELTPRRPTPIPISERGDLADAEGRSATNAEECFAKALGEGPLRDGSVQNGHTGRQEQSVQSIEVEVHSPLESVHNASPQQPQPPKPTGRLYAKAAQTGKGPRAVAKKEPEIEGGELEPLFPVNRTNMPDQQNTPPPREPLPLSIDSFCLEEGLANPISGIVVTFTGLSRDKRVSLSEKLRKMGAQASTEMDSKITHLIAEKCDPNSEKYKEARRRKLPVLLPTWVYAASAGDDLGTRCVITPEEIVGTFKTPLFAACEITVSGFPGAERVDIGRLVELHGGVFTGQMSRSSCTHLIAANNSGDKFRLAHEWGTVRVVTSRWLRKCIETGYRLSESNFAFLTDDKVGQRPFSPGWSCLSLPTNQKADNATRAETMALAPAAKKMKMTPIAKGKLARA